MQRRPLAAADSEEGAGEGDRGRAAAADRGSDLGRSVWKTPAPGRARVANRFGFRRSDGSLGREFLRVFPRRQAYNPVQVGADVGGQRCRSCLFRFRREFRGAGIRGPGRTDAGSSSWRLLSCGEGGMKDLLEAIIQSLVDKPDEASGHSLSHKQTVCVETAQCTVIRVGRSETLDERQQVVSQQGFATGEDKLARTDRDKVGPERKQLIGR